MKTLTVCYITARPEPKFDWFLDSLRPQINDWEHVEVIIVTSNPLEREPVRNTPNLKVQTVRPKPSIWQGSHRLTSCDWWAASNARNTGICLCRTDWLAFCDDRCVLLPPWLQSVREAMDGNYAVCGSYEKRHNMTVENGVIKHGGIITGRDNRDTGGPFPRIADGGHWYGCTTALPLEWALNVNGYEELLDGLSFEDIPFGMMLRNNGHPIRFDPRMKIVEDRTPGQLGEVMKRSDKGVSPRDKSHAALERFGKAKRADNWGVDLRALRDSVLRGEPFPVPNPATEWRDWYDSQLIREL